MIYVCRANSRGADYLVQTLNAVQSGVAQRLTTSYAVGREGDLFVGWGVRHMPTNVAAVTLNRTLCDHKLAELMRLKTWGIVCPAVTTTRPDDEEAWLPRTLYHENGDDFKRYLNGERGFGDYYAKRENIVREHRFHVFHGAVIKANTRYAEPDSHAWIRSEWGLGASVGVTVRHNALAVNAITAVGYDFGAVDIAELSDGGLMVLEVNSAPWLGTKQPNRPACVAYANAILAFAGGNTRG